MNKNFKFLNAFANISEDIFDKLKEIAVFKRVEAGTQLVKIGEVPSKIYMLVSGSLRCYLSTEDGKEFNKSFYLPTSFAAPLTALIQRRPSSFVFETLTDSKIYEIDYYKLLDLSNDDEELKKLYTKVLEVLYISYEERLVELISLDAKGRYLVLRKQISGVDELISQYHIASYLGITSVQLSRIRKKLM